MDTRILAESIAVNTGQSMNGSTSEIDKGGGHTSGRSQAPSSGSAIYHTSNCNIMNLEPFPAYNKVGILTNRHLWFQLLKLYLSCQLFHPLDTINRVLLEEVSCFLNI